MQLKGKKVVVVGGSSGIGLATAEMAKQEGADVIVASRNVAKLDAVAEKLNAVAIPTDVTSDQSVIELLNNVEALSPAVRASGEEAFDMVVPAIKAHDFNFTEVTRF